MNWSKAKNQEWQIFFNTNHMNTKIEYAQSRHEKYITSSSKCPKIYIYFFKSLAIYIFWPILISVLLRTGMITKNFRQKKIWKSRLDSTRRSKHNFWINFYSNCLFYDSKLTTTMLLGSFLNHRELAYCHGRPSWFHIPRGWASGVNHSRG